MTKTEPGFEEIYNSTKQNVLKFITSKCININDIEDIYQETYARVFDSLAKGICPDEPEAFVIGTAKHCLSHYYSAMQRLRARVSLNRSKDDITDTPDELADSTDIELAVINKELLDRIFKEICAQPADIQKMFYLHYFMELSLGETAKTLGISECTVRQRLYRSVRIIRRKHLRRDNDD